jgi:hypothetical protein
MTLSFERLQAPAGAPDNFLPVALPFALGLRPEGLFLPLIDAATGAVVASLPADRVLEGIPPAMELPSDGFLFGPPVANSGSRGAVRLGALSAERALNVLIGVIDLGFAFWNPRFRSLPGGGFAGLGFLGFDPVAGQPQPLPKNLGPQELSQLAATPGGEPAIRSELARRFPGSIHGGALPASAPFWHGTAMADLAAAPGVPLFGLELPRAVLEDSTGGILEAMAVPAITELLAMMRRHPTANADTQFLILMAFAFTGGPRDGSRVALEGLRARLSDPVLDGVTVVLPMGNHGAEPCVVLDAGGPLVWTLPPDDHSENTLDLFPSGPPAALHLTDPGGATARLPLGPGPALAWVTRAGRPVGLVWSRPQAGPSPPRLRITLSGTAAGPAAVQPGSWTVALEGAEGLTSDAWVLRDDRPLPEGQARPFRQAGLHRAGAGAGAGPLAPGGPQGMAQARPGTASALVQALGGQRVVAVSALERAWRDGPDRPAPYSGLTADGGSGAAAQLVDAEGPGRGILALTGGGPRLHRVSGTSVAAALHVRDLAAGV